MKTMAIATLSAALLAAYAHAGDSENEPEQREGIGNPASEYCIQQGGKLEVKKDDEGNEYALCHLPDGTIVEEWALFRSRHR